MKGYEELEKAIKENYDYHFGKDFYPDRDPDEKVRLDELKLRGFEVFKKEAIKQLATMAEDSDLFWEVMEVIVPHD